MTEQKFIQSLKHNGFEHRQLAKLLNAGERSTIPPKICLVLLYFERYMDRGGPFPNWKIKNRKAINKFFYTEDEIDFEVPTLEEVRTFKIKKDLTVEGINHTQPGASEGF